MKRMIFVISVFLLLLSVSFGQSGDEEEFDSDSLRMMDEI